LLLVVEAEQLFMVAAVLEDLELLLAHQVVVLELLKVH
jgi:hypothetical protein